MNRWDTNIRALADWIETRLKELPRANPRVVQSFAEHRNGLASIVASLRHDHASARIHITPTVCHMRLLDIPAESALGGADMLRNWVAAARLEARRQEMKEAGK